MSRARGQLADAAATEALGAVLQQHQPDQGSVHLIGDLGAGKTTLARGWLRAAGHAGAVRSPTYTLIEPYEALATPIYHLDLYRLADAEELEFIGLRDWVDTGLLLIEWPERGAGVLPAPGLTVSLAAVDGGRVVTLEAHTSDWPEATTLIEALG